MAMRIAVDAMGGDQAPAVVVEGAVRAATHAEGTLELLLFGRKAEVQDALSAHPEAADLPLRVIDAPQVIGMGESPAQAVKRKQQSSIHLGLRAHKEGQAHAFVSAGSTGAVMAASLFIMGRVAGVDRPTVMGFIPTTESYCILMDVGTNVGCRPEHLAQFGRMGAIYAREVMGRSEPRVALMNVGEEPGKGSDQVKEAFALLSETPGLNFVGNIEGRDLMHHAADVAVCDGFVGNIMLKMGEAIGTTLIKKLTAEEMERQGLSKEERSVVARVLSGIKEPFDYEARGGVPLLGVDGTVVIGHGSSSPRAIERMILTARDVAEQDVTEAIKDAFSSAPAASHP